MKPGRNDPCPCGSGEKYKKCCGKVIALTPAPAATSAMASVPAPAPGAAQRECGSCTACCDGWMAGTIRGHDMQPGTPCHFVRDGGCSIYDERPQSPCRNFSCGWVRPDSPFPDEFRPDRLGVIIAPIKWRGQPAYLLCSAGRDPDEALLDWMRSFAARTGRPFFYEIAGEKMGFGPPAFQQDMLLRAQRGEKMW
ncbi:MAG: hypothetical protein JWP38_1159 [Herbaspirillum sp.]|nr:hypothetical protein [Herbaspirillum sp.]